MYSSKALTTALMDTSKTQLKVFTKMNPVPNKH